MFTEAEPGRPWQAHMVSDQRPSLAIGGRTAFTCLQESASYESHLVARALARSSCPVAPFCATSFPDMQRLWANILLGNLTARCNELCMEVECGIWVAAESIIQPRPSQQLY